MDGFLTELLRNLRILRERAGLSQSELERRLILGPGWIKRFEEGQTLPSLDMLLAILHEVGSSLSTLVMDLPDRMEAPAIERTIVAEQVGKSIVIRFRYARFDASYTLENATVEEFDTVVVTLRNGLARLADVNVDASEAIKTDSVAKAFLTAVDIWPETNPSDLWWFVIIPRLL